MEPVLLGAVARVVAEAVVGEEEVLVGWGVTVLGLDLVGSAFALIAEPDYLIR